CASVGEAAVGEPKLLDRRPRGGTRLELLPHVPPLHRGRGNFAAELSALAEAVQVGRTTPSRSLIDPGCTCSRICRLPTLRASVSEGVRSCTVPNIPFTPRQSSLYEARVRSAGRARSARPLQGLSHAPLAVLAVRPRILHLLSRTPHDRLTAHDSTAKSLQQL